MSASLDLAGPTFKLSTDHAGSVHLNMGNWVEAHKSQADHLFPLQCCEETDFIGDDAPFNWLSDGRVDAKEFKSNHCADCGVRCGYGHDRGCLLQRMGYPKFPHAPFTRNLDFDRIKRYVAKGGTGDTWPHGLESKVVGETGKTFGELIPRESLMTIAVFASFFEQSTSVEKMHTWWRRWNAASERSSHVFGDPEPDSQYSWTNAMADNRFRILHDMSFADWVSEWHERSWHFSNHVAEDAMEFLSKSGPMLYAARFLRHGKKGTTPTDIDIRILFWNLYFVDRFIESMVLTLMPTHPAKLKFVKDMKTWRHDDQVMDFLEEPCVGITVPRPPDIETVASRAFCIQRVLVDVVLRFRQTQLTKEAELAWHRIKDALDAEEKKQNELKRLRLQEARNEYYRYYEPSAAGVLHREIEDVDELIDNVESDDEPELRADTHGPSMVDVKPAISKQLSPQECHALTRTVTRYDTANRQLTSIWKNATTVNADLRVQIQKLRASRPKTLTERRSIREQIKKLEAEQLSISEARTTCKTKIACVTARTKRKLTDIGAVKRGRF